ncbi:MAG: class I SAM-dependent methyltransferase [Steroidobacteraceae bacterium]
MSRLSTRNRVDAAIYRGVTRRGPPPQSTAVRLLTDWSFLMRAVRHVLHLPTPMHTEDRRVLERVIFGYYAKRPEVRSVLFVGCQWYTRHYERVFFSEHDYWTIEPAEEARKHGARQHVIAPLQRLDAFFPERYFDLIVCNGVFGYGLDSPEQCEAAFDHCYTRLADGGHFVLGWDDVPERRPLPLESLESLKRFRRFKFPALGTERYLTDTSYRHVYDFYARA